MSQNTESDNKQGTILVVEDSPTQLVKLTYLLEESGYNVITAKNGVEGLSALRENQISLVISDIVMPEMDGYQFCLELRKDQDLRAIPVILLTSLGDPKDVIRGLESGANNFICKPYEDHSLLARVENVLTNQKLRETTQSEMGISIFFAGQRFFITADRLQILDLLLSTYENAVDRNTELIQARQELRALNEELEARVAERTAELSAEIAERKQIEKALRARERENSFQAELLRNAPMLAAFYDLDKKIVWVNKAFEDMTGKKSQDLKGQICYLALGRTEHCQNCPIAKAIATGKPANSELVFENALSLSKKDLILAIQAAPVFNPEGEIIGMIEIAMDVTEQRMATKEHEKVQCQLQQAQKMESIGRLAGGVAHDFNNMLGVILGNTELAMEKVSEVDPIQEDLQEVLTAAKRSSEITKQLLAFARQQTVIPKIINVNETVECIFKMLRRLIDEIIEIIWRPDSEIGLIKMDPSQIDQILLNLCVNARDAITGSGKIIIETKNVYLDQEYCADKPESIPGRYVMLVVSDTGSGIDSKTISNIFEPFFTTKVCGKGTGLGLSTVFGVIKQNQGHISVYSEPDLGTTFKIYLPVIEQYEKHMPSPKAIPEILTGTETLLLVEDELGILKLNKKILSKKGYKVLAAASPKEAIALVKDFKYSIDLMVTDVVMPGMNGKELQAHLIKIIPDLKCLYVSGYTSDTIAENGIINEKVNFLQKPFTGRQLALKVREILNE